MSWLLAFLFAPAVAQTLPLELSGLQGITVEPKGEARWLTADAASQRFPGEDVPGPKFTAGEQVELIVVDGERARIRKDDRYGWVPTSVLSTTSPTPPAAPAPGGLLQMPPLLPPPPAPR